MTRGEHLSYGAFSDLKFGKLSVPKGMRPVSDFRKTSNPLVTMPFGPPQPWLAKGHEGAASSAAFGQNVNQAGYLSLWNAQPRSIAPSWNTLLMQGGNMYSQNPNSPRLSDVVVSKFGRIKINKVRRRKVTKKTSKKAKKPARKTKKSRK